MQTKKHSALESLANVGIGYLIGLISQLLVFPWVGIQASLNQNLKVSFYFTLIALVRTYWLRRWFNKKMENRG